MDFIEIKDSELPKIESIPEGSRVTVLEKIPGGPGFNSKTIDVGMFLQRVSSFNTISGQPDDSPALKIALDALRTQIANISSFRGIQRKTVVSQADMLSWQQARAGDMVVRADLGGMVYMLVSSANNAYNNVSNWEPVRKEVLSIFDLDNVAIEGITDGQVMVWNASVNKFVPGDSGSGGGSGPVDSSIVAGSNNAVAGGAVHTALVTKANLVGGKVPVAELPDYVENVIEYNAASPRPATGRAKVIYINTDNDRQFRWNGTTYVEVSARVTSTDAVAEGTTNKYYTDSRARDAGLDRITQINIGSSTVIDLTGKEDFDIIEIISTAVARQITAITGGTDRKRYEFRFLNAACTFRHDAVFQLDGQTDLTLTANNQDLVVFRKQSGKWIQHYASSFLSRLIPEILVSSVTYQVNRTGHGKTVGQAVTATDTLADYSNPASAEIVGLVSKVIDANNYRITLSGVMDYPAGGLTPGTVLFLGANGALTADEPPAANVRKVVAIAIGVDKLLVRISAGEVGNTTGGGGGGGSGDLTSYYTKSQSDGRYIRTVNGNTPDANGNVTVSGGGGSGPVDQTIIAGSVNAVAGGAVFNALATKQPLLSAEQQIRIAKTPLTPQIYGAIADNVSHPVQEWIASGRYANLAAIQADYPQVTSLADEIDWAAIMKTISVSRASLKPQTVYLPMGVYCINREIVSGHLVKLCGEGEQATIIKAILGSAATYQGSAMIRMDRGSTVYEHDQVVENMALEADGRVDYCIHAQNLNENGGLRNVKLNRYKVNGFRSELATYTTTGGPLNFYIHNISCIGVSTTPASAAAIHFGAGTSERISLKDITVTGNNSAVADSCGILIDSGSAIVTAKNIHVERSVHGILVRRGMCSIEGSTGHSSITNIITFDQRSAQSASGTGSLDLINKAGAVNSAMIRLDSGDVVNAGNITGKYVVSTIRRGNLASHLSVLSDVDVTTTAPSNGQALIWNATEGKWKPGSGGGGGGTVDPTIIDGSGNAVSGNAVFDALATKVNTVTGKGLSTNDYTTAEKNKLAGLATVATSGSFTDLLNVPANIFKYKGFYATPAALQTAIPTGTNGDFVTIGSTDTVWTWDEDTAAWKNTNTSSGSVDLSPYTRNDNGETNLDYTPTAPAFFLGLLTAGKLKLRAALDKIVSSIGLLSSLTTANKNSAVEAINEIASKIPGSYPVEIYGAIADGKDIYDGSMTAGTNILTSASANFTSVDVGKLIAIRNALIAYTERADGVSNSTTNFTSASANFPATLVGKRICLKYCGPGGTDLITTVTARASATSITLQTATSVSRTQVIFRWETDVIGTITAVNSATQVQISTTAGVSVTAATFTYATNSTNAIQAAINAAVAAGRGRVTFRPGIYGHTGLTLTGNFVSLEGEGILASRIANFSPVSDSITVGTVAAAAQHAVIRKLGFGPGCRRIGGAEINMIRALWPQVDEIECSDVALVLKLGVAGVDSCVAWGIFQNIESFANKGVIHAVRTLDCYFKDIRSQSINHYSHSFVLDGGNDGFNFRDCGLVSGAPDWTTNNVNSRALHFELYEYADRPARYGSFDGCYFDSHAFGLVANHGYAIQFSNCFFSDQPGMTIVLGSTTKLFCFSGGQSASAGQAGVWNDGTGHKFIGFDVLSTGYSTPNSPGYILAANSRNTTISGGILGNSNDGFFAGSMSVGVQVLAGANNYIVTGVHLIGAVTTPIGGHTASPTRRVYLNVGIPDDSLNIASPITNVRDLDGAALQMATVMIDGTAYNIPIIDKLYTAFFADNFTGPNGDTL